MDEKTIRAAFDPFFSTKPPGEGTGLGLSISYRIIKEWNGTIHIASTLNSGSFFTLYIPVC
jgi:signal transduction histidine kinase